ncbi:MAG: lysophospholipid acyltransferase family protein [Thermodesulfobacteriota bacterium]|nr:lysophospholipid acyltransferase family protein [Thermodesulfobacteriota bacterium]
MNLQTLLNSRFSIALGMAVGRNIPTTASYPLVRFVARRLAQQERLSVVQTVSSNQQVVHCGELTPRDLKKIVEDVFSNAGRCFIDLYRNYKNPAALQRKIVENEDLQKLITLSQDKDFGAFVVVPHLSSFDLMLLAAAARGFKAKVLTIGAPTDGYKLQNDIRATSGLEILPVSRRAHIQVIDTLRNGGFVVSGIDRPIPKQPRTLNFFDKPSPLPDGHIRMALKANVPIMVAAVHMTEDGCYQLSLSDPIPMIRMSDPVEEVCYNAENILKKIEDHIRCHPSQWLMYYPVWSGEKNILSSLS